MSDARDLPPGWRLTTVRQIGQGGEQAVLTGPFGTSMGRSDFTDSGVPVLTIGCLTHHGIDLTKAMHVAPEKAAVLQRYQLRHGDLLFSRMATVGRASIVERRFEGALFNYHLMRLRLLPEVIDPRLFVYYVHGSQMVRDYVRSVNHGATRDGINTEQLLDLPVLLPPPIAQPGIVAAIESHFSRLDAATATLERVQRNLERYRASVLKAAVEGRLVPTEAELAKKEGRSYEPASVLLKRILAERRRRWEEAELAKLKAKGKSPTDDRWKAKYEEPIAPETNGLPELPEGWCWASVGQLISRPLANGRSVPTAPEGFPVLRLTAIRSGRVLLSERKVGNWTRDDAAEWLVASGDFLVVRGNGSRDLVGRGGLVTATPDPVAFPDTLIRVWIDSAHFEPRLLSLLWDSQVVRDYLERTAKTTAGIYKINQGDLEKAPLPLPPRAEQLRLADEIERLDSVAAVEASRVESTCAHVARLRQSILKWAFEGRLVDGSDRPHAATTACEEVATMLRPSRNRQPRGVP